LIPQFIGQNQAWIIRDLVNAAIYGATSEEVGGIPKEACEGVFRIAAERSVYDEDSAADGFAVHVMDSILLHFSTTLSLPLAIFFYYADDLLIHSCSLKEASG
jgi:hypothetical protein